jgi:hypothetical protein
MAVLNLDNSDYFSFRTHGYVIMNVTQWTHISYITTNCRTEDENVCLRINCLVGQVNNVSCYFQRSDSYAKNHSFKIFFIVFTTAKSGTYIVQKLMNSINSVVKRSAQSIFIIPSETRCDILYLLADVTRVFDEIGHRVLKFVQTCYNSEPQFLKYILMLVLNLCR